MIDGVYIREALKGGPPDGVAATAMALDYLTLQLETRA
jgi:TetR/AcrR family transcriptional regulator, transcriptional repressor of bet genes